MAEIAKFNACQFSRYIVKYIKQSIIGQSCRLEAFLQTAGNQDVGEVEGGEGEVEYYCSQ